MADYSQNRRRLLIGAIIVGLVVIILCGYWALKRDPTTVATEKIVQQPINLPRMANLPPKETTAPPPLSPSYSPDAPVIEQARKALREGIDPSEALALAKSLPERPERADAAFLLLEYAADSRNAQAALAVGRYYDPTHEGPSGTIRKNPATAYDWYQMALAGGEMCVCDLAAFLNLTESAVSHQLRRLRDLALVKNRREGQVLFYSLDDEHVAELLDVGLKHVRE